MTKKNIIARIMEITDKWGSFELASVKNQKSITILHKDCKMTLEYITPVDIWVKMLKNGTGCFYFEHFTADILKSILHVAEAYNNINELKKNKKESLPKMDKNQLSEKLSQAIKDENYELAGAINKTINKKTNKKF